jgi:hypothetical protein
MEMSYDTKCYNLASAFLEDHPDKNTEANRKELAQCIQSEIEDAIEIMDELPPEIERKP